MESNIQEIATNIGFMLDRFASRLVEKLPATLTRENAHLFLRAFEDIETLTQSGYETAQKVGTRFRTTVQNVCSLLFTISHGSGAMLIPVTLHGTPSWIR